ncbi:hypothetical protein SEVIR_5G301400v4 [Setaria viridis]|uniref:Uncharacterized protein n=2 Tax=Setaria TaxID=4554 RepID=K3XN79_SETIT|nr:uncharacterized protein LOC101768561 [Setaria italica]XP_034598397.1 uncharacterized protein LOC117859292 [Setaria viridis]RCV27109.1 hypothetical protein SETIT_5G298600v2 [Setaria italica]TKW16468.1 hypothetical protein SEVIR_5G301400v2 [Setaria viridis]
MATGNATALRALVVTTLVSFLLIQGVAGEFVCCFCDCYNACKNDPSRPKDKVACHWECFNKSSCRFSCKNPGNCGRHSSNGDDVGVAIASGGGSLGMVNGTGAGGAGGGSLGMVNGTGEGVTP